MEIQIDLTHLLNDEEDNNKDIESKLLSEICDFDPDIEYTFNVYESGLSLILKR